ncbi:C45 family autoproteolytic acyltransferase/hydrolase [Sulfitobacter aestuarii]|uniref:C45 family autoproteolytic acyltransferase/hydrolase n=1 Tax=Sulfitobacter aestuarii TaxID=2161676 RepID=A0ABW5U4U9_9RHOB
MSRMTFDAISEAQPGAKWQQRWERSWPAYEAWFLGRGGDDGPDRVACRAALARHMPELLGLYDRLVELAGGGDRAARFLSTWCPPRYLGGCSLAALAEGGEVRLLRNYDLSPDLNEGLLLHSAWCGRKVMGMVEFLWGLSDGINAAGLSIALAYGGSSETGAGFGITTILRYVLETCDTVAEALAVLRRVPSHMAYNLVLADREGQIASVEMHPGGGFTLMPQPIATNHQSGAARPARAGFTRTYERHAHLAGLRSTPGDLHRYFTARPLLQDRHSEGFGTLFTAEYDPGSGRLWLRWPGREWAQSLDDFTEGQRVIDFAVTNALDGADGAAEPSPAQGSEAGAERASEYAAEWSGNWQGAQGIDWQALARDYANGKGRPVASYFAVK